jgi:hypothetical protein
MAKKKVLKLRQIIETDGESYSEISVALCAQCGISLKRPRRGDFIYIVGEDMGCWLDDKLDQLGYAPRYTQFGVPNFKAWLKGKTWPKLEPYEWMGKRSKTRSEKALPIQYDVTYTLVLKNTGGGSEGCTYGVLCELVEDAIRNIDAGASATEEKLQALLVIQEQLSVEFNKYNEGRE